MCSSDLAHPDFIKQIHRLPADRRQLVFRIRRQLAEGTYESEEKLEMAFSRMLDSVLADENRDCR